MADTLTLLTMTHQDAVKVMIQEALKPGISANALETGFTGYGTDTTAQVSVHLKESTYHDPAWNYRGQVAFQYQRLDLTDFFQNIPLEFRRSGQFHMSSIVAAINQIFSILIEPGDYVNSSIIMTSGVNQTVSLQALPTSKRWKGNVQILLTYDAGDTDGLYGDQDGQVYENQDENPYTPGEV